MDSTGQSVTRQEEPLVSYHRPTFPDAETWLAHSRWSRQCGRNQWPPITRDEIILAVEHFGAWGRRYIPPEPWRSLMAIPETLGLDIAPLTDLQQERFLATLDADPKFATAVDYLLKRTRQ